MRLTCPNCGARYEVDDAMIPPEGRDVQCSDCSTTWFQPGRPEMPPPAAQHSDAADAPEPVAEAEPEHDAPAAVPDETATRVVTPNDAEEEEVAAGPAPGDAAPEASWDEDTGPGHAAPEETGRRQIDPAIRDILREEAEREKRLREAEAVPVETQAEMPLEEEPQDARRARRRAELEEADDAFTVGAANAALAAGPRRDLLPDIEEINSTLRASEDRDSAADEQAEAEAERPAGRRRRGVRVGFLLTLAVAAALFWAYVNVGLISERAPQIAPTVQAFAAQVDAARFWLDDLARGLVEREATTVQ
ncbi:zinc-ribbon domain-containing protein [Roseicyclus sp.]|uniref:zinc-ribbon domain-containing protein n=1 Tax=Roseicyclus sp. TaxID=1914329 RepID=UPI003FA058B4